MTRRAKTAVGSAASCAAGAERIPIAAPPQGTVEVAALAEGGTLTILAWNHAPPGALIAAEEARVIVHGAQGSPASA